MTSRELRELVEKRGWIKAAMVIAMDDAINYMKNDWEIFSAWKAAGLGDKLTEEDLREVQTNDERFDELERLYEKLILLYNKRS